MMTRTEAAIVMLSGLAIAAVNVWLAVGFDTSGGWRIINGTVAIVCAVASLKIGRDSLR
jgi:hypothetical protein